jgi:hypothetical protein
MTTTKELIEWLKTPQEPHILDREECDAVIARLEAAGRMAEAHKMIVWLGANAKCMDCCDSVRTKEIAKATLTEWENLK